MAEGKKAEQTTWLLYHIFYLLHYSLCSVCLRSFIAFVCVCVCFEFGFFSREGGKSGGKKRKTRGREGQNLTAGTACNFLLLADVLLCTAALLPHCEDRRLRPSAFRTSCE